MLSDNIVCKEEGVDNIQTNRTAYDVRVKVKEQIPADLNSPHEVVIKADSSEVNLTMIFKAEDLVPPEFAEPYYAPVISDTTATGVPLVTVYATDPDGGAISYTLDESPCSSNFAVDDSLPGVVTYKTQLEGECVTGETLVLIVTATQEDRARFTQVPITVGLTRDLSNPQFDQEQFTGTLNANGDIESEKIIATDPDGDTDIEYFLLGPNSELFTRNDNGTLSTKPLFDPASLEPGRKITFMVKATETSSAPERSTTALIVLDFPYNTDPPTFKEDTLAKTITDPKDGKF
jgi:hypothetical protein